MNEQVITELTKILIKEHRNKERYVISKEELIRFCIKLVKTIDKCK